MALSKDTCNNVDPKDLSEDTQSRRYELGSSVQAFTEQEKNLNNNKKQQKKKKCRGNRKQQHQRRRLRRQQQKQYNTSDHHMDQSVLIVIDDNDDDPQEDEQQQQIRQDTHNNQHRPSLQNKRKRQVANQGDIQVSRSFSQLSISQRNPKKTKSTTVNSSTNTEVPNLVSNANESPQQQEDQIQGSDNDSYSNKFVKKIKPSYLKVPDKIFKRMLSNTIEDGDKTIQCLDTNEKLQLVREMTETTNNLYYFDLQHQLWKDYFELGMKENQWAPRVSKSFAKQHYTCRSYGFPKHIVEERLQTIGLQFQSTVNELQQNLTQLEQNVEKWQPSIHPTILSNAINECVKDAQQRLRQQFDYKRKMLALDSSDRSLITKFYELQPNKEQVYLAKQIWQTTGNILKTRAKEEIIRKRIFLRRLPSPFDKIINQSLVYIEPMLANRALDTDRRASLVSSYSKAITQYKFDLMTLNLDTLQSVIRGHQQSLHSLQSKLPEYCNKVLMQAIENRRQAMEKRHDLYLKHKLHTFFDEAPTTSNE